MVTYMENDFCHEYTMLCSALTSSLVIIFFNLPHQWKVGRSPRKNLKVSQPKVAKLVFAGRRSQKRKNETVLALHFSPLASSVAWTRLNSRKSSHTDRESSAKADFTRLAHQCRISEPPQTRTSRGIWSHFVSFNLASALAHVHAKLWKYFPNSSAASQSEHRH